jgi:hypothetical protein
MKNPVQSCTNAISNDRPGPLKKIQQWGGIAITLCIAVKTCGNSETVDTTKNTTNTR